MLFISFYISAGDLERENVTFGSNYEAKITSESSSTSLKRSRTVIYLNGMYTGLESLMENVLSIKTAVQSLNASVIYVHNVSEKGLEELAEVISQKIAEDEYEGNNYKYWQEASNVLLNSLNSSGGYTALGHLEKSAELAVAMINAENLPTDYDTEKMVARVIDSINSNNNVVILAHSQGNFYANSVYDKIGLRYGDSFLKHLRVVSVATPSSYTRGNGKHTTNIRDVIIQLIRRTTSNEPREANIDIPFFSSDRLGHGLSDTYLNNSSMFQGHINSIFDITSNISSAFVDMENESEPEPEPEPPADNNCIINGKNYSVTFTGHEEHTPNHDTVRDYFSGFKETFRPPNGSKFIFEFSVWDARPASLYNTVQFNWKFSNDSRVNTFSPFHPTDRSSRTIYYSPSRDGSVTFGVRHTTVFEPAYNVKWKAKLKCVY